MSEWVERALDVQGVRFLNNTFVYALDSSVNRGFAGRVNSSPNSRRVPLTRKAKSCSGPDAHPEPRGWVKAELWTMQLELETGSGLVQPQAHCKAYHDPQSMQCS